MFKIGLKNVQVVLGDSNLELDLPFGVQTHQVEKEEIVLTIGKKTGLCNLEYYLSEVCKLFKETEFLPKILIF